MNSTTEPSIEDKVNLLFTQYQQQAQENARQQQEKHQDELGQKYDLVLDVLKEEYFFSIESMRQVEEKINKFLVILTIVFTGLFTILASSLLKLKFYHTLTGITLNTLISVIISYLFVILLFISFYHLGKIVNYLIDGLAFFEVHRLPDMNEILTDNDLREVDVNKFKEIMLTTYQSMITFNNTQKDNKQRNLTDAHKLMKKSLLFTGLAMLLLLVNNFLN